MSDISTDAMMREAAMMDASDNHVWARKVRRLCIERDKLKAQIAALPPAPDAEADKLRRTIAARDRRIERLVAALDVARAKGYVTQAEQEPPIVLSAPDAVDALVKAADFAEFITDDERMTDIDLTYVPMGAIRRLRAALAALTEGSALASWQCVFTDGKTGLVGDEYGNQFCQMQRRAEAAEANVASLKEQVEAMRDGADMAKRRLEAIADEAWNGDARDFKRRIPGVFAEFAAALTTEKKDD